MLHLVFLGILLGWGAAIPIGPVNLEIMRRNLRYGTGYGISLGFGACAADLTYLILLCTGAIFLLKHHILFSVIGLLGSAILIWFGLNALRAHKVEQTNKISNHSYFKNFFEGYLMTILNPYTILFWASISTQLSIAAEGKLFATIAAGTGVILGTVSWVLLLNTIVHHTRHKLDVRISRYLNIFGGIILLGFAILTIAKVFIGFM